MLGNNYIDGFGCRYEYDYRFISYILEKTMNIGILKTLGIENVRIQKIFLYRSHAYRKRNAMGQYNRYFIVCYSNVF
jgi:hypothetical protein